MGYSFWVRSQNDFEKRLLGLSYPYVRPHGTSLSPDWIFVEFYVADFY
jgi:hypothetical protein